MIGYSVETGFARFRGDGRRRVRDLARRHSPLLCPTPMHDRCSTTNVRECRLGAPSVDQYTRNTPFVHARVLRQLSTVLFRARPPTLFYATSTRQHPPLFRARRDIVSSGGLRIRLRYILPARIRITLQVCVGLRVPVT